MGGSTRAACPRANHRLHRLFPIIIFVACRGGWRRRRFLTEKEESVIPIPHSTITTTTTTSSHDALRRAPSATGSSPPLVRAARRSPPESNGCDCGILLPLHQPFPLCPSSRRTRQCSSRIFDHSLRIRNVLDHANCIPARPGIARTERGCGLGSVSAHLERASCIGNDIDGQGSHCAARGGYERVPTCRDDDDDASWPTTAFCSSGCCRNAS